MARIAPRNRAFLPSLLTAAIGLGLSGCDRPASRKPSGGSRYDANYLAANATANEFCEAWRLRDVPAGKALLSSRAKRTYPDARIHDALAGSPSPLHASFEVHSGTRGSDGSLAFRLLLHYRYLGQAQERIESREEQIVLTRDESGAWLVDRFPLLAGE